MMEPVALRVHLTTPGKVVVSSRRGRFEGGVLRAGNDAAAEVRATVAGETKWWAGCKARGMVQLAASGELWPDLEVRVTGCGGAELDAYYREFPRG